MRQPSSWSRFAVLVLLQAALIQAVLFQPAFSAPASAEPEASAQVLANIVDTGTGCEGYSDSVPRLYRAAFGRLPDQGGFDFWFDEYRAGRWSLPRMASFFAESEEFIARNGSTSNQAFVEELYRNVLGRDGEPGGVGYWTGRMDGGMTRGTLLLRFSESPENIQLSGTATPILGDFNEGRVGPFPCDATGAICGVTGSATGEFYAIDAAGDHVVDEIATDLVLSVLNCPDLVAVEIDYYDAWTGLQVDDRMFLAADFGAEKKIDLPVTSTCTPSGIMARPMTVTAWTELPTAGGSETPASILSLEIAADWFACGRLFGPPGSFCELEVNRAIYESSPTASEPMAVLSMTDFQWQRCTPSATLVHTFDPTVGAQAVIDGPGSGMTVDVFGYCRSMGPEAEAVSVRAVDENGETMALYQQDLGPTQTDCDNLFP